MTLFATITVVVVLILSVNYTNQDQRQTIIKLLSTADSSNSVPQQKLSNKRGYDRQDNLPDLVPPELDSIGVQKKHITRRGYVMALKYSGQQAVGIQALISLQCWATSFHLPVAILEPIMSGTEFISISPQNRSFIRFSDLFDIEHFNQRSKSTGKVPMGTREDFIMNAPTEVIYVRIQESSISRASKPQIVDSVLDEKKHCYEVPREIFQINQLGRANFCITRKIEVQYSFISSVKKLQKLIFGSRSPQDVTVVFDYWRARWYFDNSNTTNNITCKGAGNKSKKEQFIQSPRLLSDSISYEKQFLNSNNNVALMIRLEHMIEFIQKKTSPHVKWTVDSCLQDALKITKKYLNSSLPMITLDVGTFGSIVMNEKKGVEELTEKSKIFLNKLFDGKLTFEEWEASFTKAASGDVENSGYIAALQRTLASRAKCLVLAGGGHFQTLALWDYLRNHPNEEERCVHHVCALNQDFLNVILSNDFTEFYP